MYQKNLSTELLFYWSVVGLFAREAITRFKVIEKGNERIIRFAGPVLDLLNHTVDVKYKIIGFSNDKVMGQVDEVHKVRFLFPQEIKLICDIVGFKVLESCQFEKLGIVSIEKNLNVAEITRKV